MRIKKREIENAIQELNDVIMDLAIYADSLRSVRETLESILDEYENKASENDSDNK
jgi:NTP pyrophosphatase (non-canonical NTP hydrolase)